MGRHVLLNGVIAAFIGVIGCAPASQESASPTTPNNAVDTPAPDSVEVQVATWEEVQAAVAVHRGKIVVLDLWSNYCPPCMKELPGLVKLNRQAAGDVVCMTLNCNFSGIGQPGDEVEAAVAYLREIDARMQNFASRDVDQDLYRKIGIASVPVVQVYGRDGTLSKQFDNESDAYGSAGFTYDEHVTPYVEQLRSQ